MFASRFCSCSTLFTTLEDISFRSNSAMLASSCHKRYFKWCGIRGVDCLVKTDQISASFFDFFGELEEVAHAASQAVNLGGRSNITLPQRFNHTLQFWTGLIFATN